METYSYFYWNCPCFSSQASRKCCSLRSFLHYLSTQVNYKYSSKQMLRHNVKILELWIVSNEL